jgi:hypothetical protein
MSQNNQEQTTQAPGPASRYPETIRTLFAAFAHHNKPLWGLMSTAKSPSFQGRFGRMFRSLTGRDPWHNRYRERLTLRPKGPNIRLLINLVSSTPDGAGSPGLKDSPSHMRPLGRRVNCWSTTDDGGGSR